MPHASTTLVLTLSQSSFLIRNALLALAACHLRCSTADVPEHRIAEHFQQAVTLKEFQGILGMRQEELGQESANAMMMCALLLNVHAFVLPGSDRTDRISNRSARSRNSSSDTASTIITTRSNSSTETTSTWDFDWLGLQAGLRPLFVYMAPYVSESIAFMEGIFLTPSDSGAMEAGASRHPTWAAAALAQGYRRMPKLWGEHFGMPRCEGELEDAFTRTYTSGRGYSGAGGMGVAGNGHVEVEMEMDEEATMDLYAERKVHADCLGPSAPLMFRQDAVTIRIANNFATTSSPKPSLYSIASSLASSEASTSITGNIYTIPASILVFLSSVRSSSFSATTKPSNTTTTTNKITNIFPLLQFAVKATPAFRLALSMRDERALFLYCYWLKLMRNVRPDGGDAGEEGEGGTWWSRTRVDQEWWDIVRYLVSLGLEAREGAEGERWAELMGELGLAGGRI